jgi:hypothetical protein
MSESVVVIPIKPYLKSFIYKLYRQKPDHPIKVEEDDASELGHHLYNVIIDKRVLSKGHDVFSDSLQVILPKRMKERSPRLNKLVRINLVYDKTFKRSLYLWVEAQCSMGIPAYRSVERFLRHFNISEAEYSKESAYRAFQRYKNKEYHRNKSFTPPVS